DVRRHHRRGGRPAPHVRADALRRRALRDDDAAVEQQRLGAQRRDAVELVRHDDHRDVAPQHLLQSVVRPLLEREVAHGEHLIDDQHVGLEVGRDGEAEARVHPGRI
ncbi:MAG: hypothetical protein AVDCRST_MAG11-250, partial [uncultured Gemmatimonadaceae bacterium]